MKIWPVFIDSEPPYLSPGGVSLLRAPIGRGLLVSLLCRRTEIVTSDAPTILAPPGSGPDYRARMASACPSAVVVTTTQELAAALAPAEVSDAILFVDPRCLPLDEDEFELLMVRSAARPQVARHLVAFAAQSGGTKEHVNVDGHGLVTSMHRYHEPAAWPFIAGVAASFIPVSSGILPLESDVTSLVDLRRHLASCGVPSHDVSIRSDAFDLTNEQGLLAAAERYVIQAVETMRLSKGTSTVLAGDGQVIHSTARLMGPIVIQSNARVDANATIVGPTLVGEGAHVSAGAVLAHVVVGAEALVPPGRVLRDRGWFTQSEDRVHGVEEERTPSYTDRLARYNVQRRNVLRAEAPDRPHSRWNGTWKRIFDAVVAAISLCVLSPFLLLVAALVRLDSKGPAFYSDEREGNGGRLFRCLKFRTMGTGASALQRQLKSLDKLDGPHFKLNADPRVTRLGRILRATNIDELPQLANVLVGEMSLVGPRPSPFRENQICMPWREARLSVRPGMTGLWQVCRQDRASGDFHQWIEYDLLYVQHVSVLLDLKILAATVFSLGGKIPVPVSWMLRRAGRKRASLASSAPIVTNALLRRHQWKGVRAFSRIGRQNRSVRPT